MPEKCWFESITLRAENRKKAYVIFCPLSQQQQQQQQKNECYELHEVRFYCGVVVLDCGGFSQVWLSVTVRPADLGVLLKYQLVLCGAAHSLRLETPWAAPKNVFTYLSGRNMVDNADKVCLSDSHKQQAATIALTTTHPKHLCCIVNVAAAEGKLIPASAVECDELCFTELSGLKLQVSAGDGNRMTPSDILKMCMIGGGLQTQTYLRKRKGYIITVYCKAYSMQKLQCICLKQM